MVCTSDLLALAQTLSGAGCVAAVEEAEELLRVAESPGDLTRMLAKRMAGEPLAWITGFSKFCGLDLTIQRGVYVPRWQSESLARLACSLLPIAGTAVDLATGAGSIAAVIRSANPGSRVIATDIDPIAVKCARGNGLEVYEGDLYDALPAELTSSVDVLTAVLPYVPHDMFHLLPRDVRHFEPRLALDGGGRGLEVISKAIAESSLWLRNGGWFLLEVGPDQISDVAGMLEAEGYEQPRTVRDGDGDPRGLAARLDLS